MWSAKLAQSIRGLGHEMIRGDLDQLQPADVAIVNLGELGERSASVVENLHGLGMKVVAHAGHKEKELLLIGKESGADFLASNSQLTFKLPQIFDSLFDGTKIEEDSRED